MLEISTNRDKILRALQEMELELLKELDRICRKNNIEYSLGGGTCLGQVRHGGFIPWDDDIDVDMTRDNYDRFMKCAELELDKSRYAIRYRNEESNYYRTSAMLEFKDSHIGMRSWDSAGMNVGVFIDIFQWNYLPNNTFLRKVMSTLLYYVRTIEHYKMVGDVAKQVHPMLKPLIKFLGIHATAKAVINFEERLVGRVKGKTNWVIDDAIIHGNHMGYPSYGTDVYKDVEFEGIKVRGKIDPDGFLRTLYGPNYMEWLPAKKRISHHKWTNVYFGEGAAEKYQIPDNYSDYLSIAYNETKLRQMKKVSFAMAKKVYDICDKYDLKCYTMGIDERLFHKNLYDELGDIFISPLTIGMELDDYNVFCNIAQSELGGKYFLQNKNSEANYVFDYSKIRLNETSVRDKRVPRAKEELMNEGFHISVVPLVPTSSERTERKKHIYRIKKYNRRINYKWKNDTLYKWYTSGMKKKIKILLIQMEPYALLRSRLGREWGKYKNEREYLCDGSGYQLKRTVYSRESIDNAVRINCFGVDMLFPAADDSITFDDYTEERLSEIASYRNESSDLFCEAVNKYRTDLNEIVSERLGYCFLNYYDDPDYQLSALRYDEKTDSILSNEEILGYK